MNAEQEQFEQVRRVLALKRHEQPPPGYFREFSSKVIARLHALQAAPRVTWRQRLGLDVQFSPALIGAIGVVVCGLLLLGVLTAPGESQPSTLAVAGDPSIFFASPVPDPAFGGGAGLKPIVKPEEIPASTVPVAPGSPFEQLRPQPQRTGFSFGAGN